MNEIQIFNNPEFGLVRITNINGEPWFVGKDVCEAFGDTNYRRSLATLDELDKGVSQIDTAGGKQNMVIINESGLYSLLFQMQPQKARGVSQNDDLVEKRIQKLKRFKRWVTSEVLPSIRKTGSYQIPLTTEGQIKLLAQGHTELFDKINKVDKDLQNFKQDMPLLALECQRITKAKNQKVVPLMGGKNAPAYKDNSLRGKVYSDIDSQLRREFGVDTYKAIKRSQCDLAVKIIAQYELPMALLSQIEMINAQMSF